MTLKKISSLFSIIFIFQVCSPVRVISTRTKPEVNFSNFQTFNFLDISLKNEGMGDENALGVQMLKNSLETKLTQKGFKKSENPDLWVNIGIVTEEKVQTRRTNFREAPIYIGQRNYSWQSKEVEVGRYRLGTVSVDLVDANNNVPIWEGVVQGTITENPEKLKRRIDQGIEKLMEKIPTNP